MAQDVCPMRLKGLSVNIDLDFDELIAKIVACAGVEFDVDAVVGAETESATSESEVAILITYDFVKARWNRRRDICCKDLRYNNSTAASS